MAKVLFLKIVRIRAICTNNDPMTSNAMWPKARKPSIQIGRIPKTPWRARAISLLK